MKIKNVKVAKSVKIAVTAVLILLMMVSILYSTILGVIMRYSSKEFVIAKLEDIKVYKQIYDDIENDFENYIYQSGLEMDVLKGIYDEEKIKKDFLAIVDYIYDDEDIKIDSSDIIQKLDQNIKQYVASQNKTLKADEQRNIEEFEVLIANSYGGNLSKYIELAKQVKTEEVQNILNGLAPKRTASAVITLVLAIILVVINRKNIFFAIGYIGSVVLASGVALMLGKAVVYSKIQMDGIMLFNKVISNIVVYVVKENLSLVNSIGAWYIGIGIFVILMTSILGIDTKNSDKSKEQEENKKEEFKDKEEKAAKRKAMREEKARKKAEKEKLKDSKKAEKSEAGEPKDNLTTKANEETSSKEVKKEKNNKQNGKRVKSKKGKRRR